MTDRLHYRLLAVATGIALSTLAILYVLAIQRVRDKRVVPYEPDVAAMEEDLAVTAEQLGEVEERALDRARPNVVVVLLGGVRPDRISDATMPRFRAWRQDALRAIDARSVASWQAPAKASVLTGLHPSEHGMHRGSSGTLAPLSEDLPLLSERLQAAGYRTAAVLADTRFHHVRTGLGRGWDVLLDRDLEDGDPPLGYARADRITAMARQVLDAWEGDPVFLLAEYLDGCTPWVPWDATTEDVFAINPGVLHFPGESAFRWRGIVSAVMQDKRPPHPHERDTWRAAYRADLLQLDEQLGELLERVEDGRETWVFVVGTHGEAFGEHDVLGHGWDLFSETVEIPWAYKGPGIEAGLDEAPVELTDLHAQVLAAAGLGAWPEPDEGRLRVAETFYGPARELRLARGRAFKRVKRAFAREGHVLMLDTQGGVWPYRLGQGASVASGPWTEDLVAAAEAWLAARVEEYEASEEAP